MGRAAGERAYSEVGAPGEESSGAMNFNRPKG